MSSSKCSKTYEADGSIISVSLYSSEGRNRNSVGRKSHNEPHSAFQLQHNSCFSEARHFIAASFSSPTCRINICVSKNMFLQFPQVDWQCSDEWVFREQSVQTQTLCINSIYSTAWECRPMTTDGKKGTLSIQGGWKLISSPFLFSLLHLVTRMMKLLKKNIQADDMKM